MPVFVAYRLEQLKKFTKLISISVLENVCSVSIGIMSLERINRFTKLKSRNVSENAWWVSIVSLPYQNSKGEVEQRREHRRESETEKRLFFVLFIILNKHKKTLEGKTKKSVFTSRFVNRNILIGKIGPVEETKTKIRNCFHFVSKRKVAEKENKLFWNLTYLSPKNGWNS